MTSPREAERWSALVEHGAVDAIDVQFARWLERAAVAAGAAADAAWTIAMSAALVSRERSAGHSCVSLSEWAGRTLAADDDTRPTPAHALAALTLPEVDAWRRTLEQADSVRAGEPEAPLALTGDRLYLQRLLAAEAELASSIRARLAADTPALASATTSRLRAAFGAAFPPQDDVPRPNLQAAAACAALAGRLTVVLGGPGTGKTTTVARILTIVWALEPAVEVALCAPTGKAAARLEQSIHEQAQRPEVDADARNRLLALEARTIHRLLDYLPPPIDRFRRDAASPITADVLVVDEASMIDLELMAALLRAARPSARVLLLGDPDQLASVATGHVLGDLASAAQPRLGAGDALAERFADWTGTVLPRRDTTSTRLADHVVELRHSWRFDADRSGIGRLAAAVRDGDAATAIATLADESFTDVALRAPSDDPARLATALVDALDEHVTATIAATHRDPEAFLAQFATWRILCALRRGPLGVEQLNERLQALVERRGGGIGRPIQITANDDRQSLYNGDVGVVWSDPGLARRAWFVDTNGSTRSFAPARLPQHEPSWATTIHKSQGSEFDAVAVVLTEPDHPLCTRELLYTALTRARSRVEVFGTAAAVRAAIEHPTRRASGLADRLAAP